MPTVRRSRVFRWLDSLFDGAAAAVRPHVLDETGRSVPLFDSRVRRWRDPATLDFPQRDFQKVYYRLPPPPAVKPLFQDVPTDRLWSLPIVGGVGLLAGVVGISAAPGRPLAAVLLSATAILAVVGAVFYVAFRWWRARFRVFPKHVTPQDVVTAMLAESRCPSCAYRLERSETPERTACSECGSMWNCARGFWTQPLARGGSKPHAKRTRWWRMRVM